MWHNLKYLAAGGLFSLPFPGPTPRSLARPKMLAECTQELILQTVLLDLAATMGRTPRTLATRLVPTTVRAAPPPALTGALPAEPETELALAGPETGPAPAGPARASRARLARARRARLLVRAGPQAQLARARRARLVRAEPQAQLARVRRARLVRRSLRLSSRGCRWRGRRLR